MADRKYDLGGVGCGGPYTTVNLVNDCDIRCDLIEVDQYISEDGVVDEFYLSHTLEHIPVEQYLDFIQCLKRKLYTGGLITVIQTDAADVMRLWHEGKLSFRAMRTTLFTPEDRIRENPFHRHHNMWSAEELAKDFQAIGMRAEIFDAGSWSYDQLDLLYPEETRAYHGLPIKNLGVRAWKQEDSKTRD